MVFVEGDLKWDTDKMKMVAQIRDPGSISFDDTWQLFRTENGRWALLRAGENEISTSWQRLGC